MKNKSQTKPQTRRKENEHMQSVTASRPCTITDSITQSCQEIRKNEKMAIKYRRIWTNFSQTLNNGAKKVVNKCLPLFPLQDLKKTSNIT